MSFSTRCPHCQSRITAKSDKVVGKQLPCPKCKQVFTVEKPAAENPAPGQPAPSKPTPSKPVPKPVPKPASETPARSVASPVKPAAPSEVPAAPDDPFGLGNLDSGPMDFGSSEPGPLDGDFAADFENSNSGFPALDLGALPSTPVAPVAPRPVTAQAAAPAPSKKGLPAILFERPILVGAVAGGGLLCLILFGVTLAWMFSGSPTQTAANQDSGSSTVSGAGAIPGAADGGGGGGASSSSVQASLNQLKQLIMAFHNYHDTYKTFPPAIQLGPNNVPHSWRVSILPFLEQQSLYDQYRMDQPWDSPSNQKVLAQMPDVFLSPGRLQESERNTTNFVGFSLPPSSGPMDSARLPALGGTRACNLADILDGTANVILLVETKVNIPWTKPTDVPFDPDQPLPKLGGVHAGGFCAGICDGSATFFPDTYDPAMLLRCILRGDGEPVELPVPPEIPRPAPRETVREERPTPSGAAEQTSINNLRKIALAFHNYHDIFNTLPSAVQIGPKDVPHSWRVTLLPYMNQKELYDQYRLDEPWDSPHNRTLLSRMPDIYRAPNAAQDTHTTSYFGFTPVGQNQSFDPVRTPVLAGNRPRRFADIIDGTTNVILVVESILEVPWTQPSDVPFDLQQPLPQLGGIHPGGFGVAMCDGIAKFIPDSYDRDLLMRLIQPADGERVPMPEEVAQREAEARQRQRLISTTNPEDKRKASMAHLKQIALALHNYHDTYKAMPPAVQIGPKNVPHSWRVALLPFLDQMPLYRKYRLDEPWDSPHNQGLLNEMPMEYRAPGSSPQSTYAGYFGFSVPEAAQNKTDFMPIIAGSKYANLARVVDGLENTMLIVETRLDVPWTQPLDVPFDPSSQSPPELGGIHAGGFFGANGTGRVLFFPDSFDRSMLLRMLKRGDGERVVLPPFE